MSEDTNVVSFPKPYLGPPRNVEEATEDTDFFKLMHIEEGLDIVVPVLMNQLTSMGFFRYDWDDPDTEKKAMMITEAIRAYMCEHHKIDHPLHEFSSNFFTYDKDGSLLINETDNIIFSKKDDKETPKEEQKSLKE